MAKKKTATKESENRTTEKVLLDATFWRLFSVYQELVKQTQLALNKIINEMEKVDKSRADVRFYLADEYSLLKIFKQKHFGQTRIEEYVKNVKNNHKIQR